MGSETGAVSGTITFSNNGTGIAGVTVNVTKEGTVIASKTTDSNGDYLVNDISPGDYTLTVSKIRFWSNSTSVIVTAGGTVTAHLAL
jgi:uncharacterized surface anchored protein